MDVKATLLSMPVTITEGARSAACCLTRDDCGVIYCIILMDSSMRNVGESRKGTCMRISALTHP